MRQERDIMAVLVCGGAGYIGSHVNLELHKNGFETVVFDSLISGHKEAVKWGRFVQGDLNDVKALEVVFQSFDISAVLHFAAFAYVGESVAEPEKYYLNNVSNTLQLLRVMRKFHCEKIVFSSTCATYGQPDRMPISEDMPQMPLNPYGRSKLMVEQILKDYDSAYGIRHVILRYFNAAGADWRAGIGESHTPETHLIPLVLEAACGKRNGIEVFGTDYPTQDGTCVRDYIHVSDLADAHLRALRYLESGGASECFNLGNARGTSVLEIIHAVKKVTGAQFQVIYSDRRPGDPALLVGCPDKAKRVLGWEPRLGSIDEIVGDAWEWEMHRAF